MSAIEMQQEALTRAVSGQAMTNYGTIYAGFMAMGIPEDQIQPRENVFTYQAWLALGRQVRKGSHGVKVTTWVTRGGKESTDASTGETKQTGGYRFCKTTTVFHVSQTDAAGVIG